MTRRQKRVRPGRMATVVWMVFTLAVLAITAPRLWRSDTDSFRSTWEAVAAGAENVSPLGTVTVWDGARETISPETAPFLILARVGGMRWAGVSYWVWIVFLSFLWAAGARRLAMDLELGMLECGALGTVAALMAMSLAGGRVSTLAAAPALWMVAAVVRDGGARSVLLPLLSLAALSRPAFLLAVPLTALAALWRAGREEGARGWLWIPPVVAFFLFLALPEPDWCHFLRSSAAHYFAGGPYDLPRYSIAKGLTVWLTAGSKGSVGFDVLAGILWIAAVFGTARSGERGRRLFAVTVLLMLVSLGSGPPRIVERFGISSPAVFLAQLVPSLKFHAFTDLAGALAAPFLLVLMLRVSSHRIPRLVLLFLALAPVLAAARGATREPPVASELATAMKEHPGRTLALPISVTNDWRWRRALPTETKLLNGLQEILDRNAPLLASELATAGPESIRPWAGRLGVEQVIAPESVAGALGEVLASAGGESLVRLGSVPLQTAPPACLPTANWRLRSSVGISGVSLTQQAIDHNLNTRWGTGEPQRPGQFLEIDLGELHRLVQLDLQLGRFATDYPRGFRVLASLDGKTWTVVTERSPYLGEFAWNGTFPYYDVGRIQTVRVPLRGVTARAVRIELVKKTRIYDWSIAEVCLLGERSSGTNGSP